MKGVEKIKHDLLVLWVRENSESGYTRMEMFDKIYKALFNEYPLWYIWGSLYRDHGCVGIRRSIAV